MRERRIIVRADGESRAARGETERDTHRARALETEKRERERERERRDPRRGRKEGRRRSLRRLININPVIN
jgi:hypothetical protein